MESLTLVCRDPSRRVSRHISLTAHFLWRAGVGPDSPTHTSKWLHYIPAVTPLLRRTITHAIYPNSRTQKIIGLPSVRVGISSSGTTIALTSVPPKCSYSGSRYASKLARAKSPGTAVEAMGKFTATSRASPLPSLTKTGACPSTDSYAT